MRYRIVFEGRLVEGEDPDRVRERIARLFGADRETVDRLFDSLPATVKRDLDRATAVRYQRAFEKTGALCEIGPMEEEAPRFVVSPPPPPPTTEPQESSTEAQTRGRRRDAPLLLSLAAVLALSGFLAWRALPVRHGPGPIAPSEPIQTKITDRRPFAHGVYTVTPLASFSLEARVLSTRRYRFDRESELAPWDFALGWGPMSDESVLDALNIRQGARFYTWSARTLPVPRSEIETHSSNMHLIPANRDVARALGSARTGQLARLDGYLVSVTSPDNWRWKSSLSRNDTGAGACEVVWVERLELH